MTTTKAQEAFEKWFLANYEGPLEQHGRWHEDEQRYTRYSILDRAWEIWKAGQADLLARIKAGGGLSVVVAGSDAHRGETLYRLPEGEK